MIAVWLTLIGGGYGYLKYQYQSEIEKTNDKWRNLAKTVSSAPEIAEYILLEEIANLEQMLSHRFDEPELEFIVIVNHENKVIFSRIVNTEINVNTNSFEIPDAIPKENQQVAIKDIQYQDTDIILIYSAIMWGKNVVGKVYIGISKNKILYPFKKSKTYFSYIFFISIVILFLFLLASQLLFKNIGHYELKEKIGEGGMAVIYLAENRRVKELKFVVKKVKPELAVKENFIHQFEIEAENSLKLKHQNVVTVFDYFKKKHALIMEYVEGKNLSEICKKSGPLEIDLAIYIAVEICKGIAHAHQKNMIHRDIKPSNILISYTGIVKVSDFGIAKALKGPTGAKGSSQDTISLDGGIKGTLAYASPEQVQNKNVKYLTDIYSFGIVFYEMLSGSILNAFGENTETFDAMEKIVRGEIEQIINLRPDIPKYLNDIIMKCLQKEQTKRFQSVLDIIQKLELLQQKKNMFYSSIKLSEFMNQFRKTDS